MDFESRIWQFCCNVHICLENMFDPLLAEEGLNLIQAKLLFLVFERKSLSVGELSALTRMNAGNCSTMCKKLEARKLLCRERKKDDERVVVLSLTPEGERAVSGVFEHAMRRQRECLAKIGDEEKEAFLTQLEKVEKFFTRLSAGCCAPQEGPIDGK